MFTFEEKLQLVKIAQGMEDNGMSGAQMAGLGAGATGAGVAGKYMYDEYGTQKGMAEAIKNYAAKRKAMGDKLITTGSERSMFDTLGALMQQAELEKGQRGSVPMQAMQNLGQDVASSRVGQAVGSAAGKAKDLGLAGKARMIELAKKMGLA